MLRIAENTAKKFGLELIEISAFRLNNLIFNHKIKTNIGIEEFLGYFANASYVMCNAFHGSCFSVLFEKPFYLFQREPYDYRMKSLIFPLGLDNIYISEKKASSLEYLPLPNINYQCVNKKLEDFRISSMDYLLKALGVL